MTVFIVAVGIGLNRASIFSPFPFDFAGCATCAIQGNVFLPLYDTTKPVKIDFIGVVLTHKVFKHKAQRGYIYSLELTTRTPCTQLQSFCGLGKKDGAILPCRICFSLAMACRIYLQGLCRNPKISCTSKSGLPLLATTAQPPTRDRAATPVL